MCVSCDSVCSDLPYHWRVLCWRKCLLRPLFLSQTSKICPSNDDTLPLANCKRQLVNNSLSRRFYVSSSFLSFVFLIRALVQDVFCSQCPSAVLLMHFAQRQIIWNLKFLLITTTRSERKDRRRCQNVCHWGQEAISQIALGTKKHQIQTPIQTLDVNFLQDIGQVTKPYHLTVNKMKTSPKMSNHRFWSRLFATNIRFVSVKSERPLLSHDTVMWQCNARPPPHTHSWPPHRLTPWGSS